MIHHHTVKLFDDELRHLHLIVAQMGGLAEQQIADATSAITKRDSALAVRSIESGADVDKLEHEVDHQVVRLLAVRQPLANDLRAVVSATRMASYLERIADYAKTWRSAR